MKAAIVYASMTGTTELMANTIAEELEESGIEVVQKDVLEACGGELPGFDLILIGSYTWGDGDLPDEMDDFYSELLETDLAGKPAVVFGAGDSSYEHFARAVDILEETLRGQGCLILLDGVKADGEPDDEIMEISRTFAKKVVLASCWQ
ncbi:flavodoxin [Bacillus sp. FJAT-27445]|uniref:flavodoxin n=1 Tax=Bacillus sp. FJAT-27445 TaxID=1679166 RepID=UPI000743A6D0|nr:flavodoxin [Bacillus sp. FJAT-27445]